MGSSTNQLRLVSIGAFVILFFAGLHIFFSDHGNNCEMTYMFEYPKFVHIKVPGNEFYPQYSLYSYSEGRLTEKARKMRFDGIPVLYLPGNCGSRSQSRSLASVALRMGLSDEYESHFDYFTISFNEELSGLYGGVLEMQTKFTSLAMRRILNLYESIQFPQAVPSTVIVIGHSMGGVIAKRLLLYEDSKNMTSLAVTLAAPIAAPVLNLDTEMNSYYMTMQTEWTESKSTMENKKILINFGGGQRDVMVPSSYVSSNDSDFSAVMSSIPGVWAMPDHLSIVWCRQFIIRFNRFMFSIVNRNTRQIVNDKKFILSKAKSFFEANRSMVLDQHAERKTYPAVEDAFWYEDNRRIFQITRPSVNKMTYLMIRLVGIYTNRFVAIETVNHTDKDWLYGCTAVYTHNNQRTCKNVTSLAELTRWTGAAQGFGRRKLATVHLHDVMNKELPWTHVIVKISPTKHPVELNVDINDYASRNITVELPSMLSFDKKIIKKQTEPSSIYYELVLVGMTEIFHTYLLYVEPNEKCGSKEYHVSAEMHIPWARNSEYYHFFSSKSSKPMKLRLFNTKPNVLNGTDVMEHAKVTLLLDPKCTFSIIIESSRFEAQNQLLLQHLPVVFPYMASILLLSARISLKKIMYTGSCGSMFSALASDVLTIYLVALLGHVGTTLKNSTPGLLYYLHNAGHYNVELGHLAASFFSIPFYMVALGALNVLAFAGFVIVLFFSQLAQKLLLKIIWRGGGGVIAEKLAGVIQKAPVLISAALVLNVFTSCGAASLAAGAVFYFFMISKLCEEYLEDYAYKLLAKFRARIRQYFKGETTETTSELKATVPKSDVKDGSEHVTCKTKCEVKSPEERTKTNIDNSECKDAKEKAKGKRKVKSITDSEMKKNYANKTTKIDENLSGLNFHFIMFSLWMVVACVNLPVLLTWARNFKFSMVVRPDTSFYPGLIMSVCAGFSWQIAAPKKNLMNYDIVCLMLFILSNVVIIMGPSAGYYINYSVMAAFVIITLQQLLDGSWIDEIHQGDATNGINSEPEQTNEAGTSKNEKHQGNDTIGINSEPEQTNEAGTSQSVDAEEKIYEKIINYKEKVDSNDFDSK